ncbi:flavodoxin family protein [Fervidobacterium gondwanense]|uniref:Flavodoxin n=1 Tax=Fervidobacterium gondwanense DSM 13020 TaxID=1121883 RepID=A0A1M7S8J5_FERGO|nr:flavodoxin [Fervidobacterium gondwanense]SHN54763.1 Flavodoxin [Fervidobacterium gondwanense DSM 13020]
MKSLVVFFSLEGHTKYVAKLLAEELKADLVELETVKEYPKRGFAKYFWCGKASVFREKPELKTKIPDFSKYELIVIGTPVWAGNCTPPINTLLSKASFSGKKLGILVTNGGGSIAKCVKQITKVLPGNNVLQPLHFVNPEESKREEILQKIRSWINAINE